MFGKMILPVLGSSPSVWNSCMVFFQASLFLGYIYAHATCNFLGVRKQAFFHLGLLFLPLLVLPVSLSGILNPPVDENPIPWLLMTMSLSVGLPFFVVSTSAPLLQKWFSSTTHKDANDPYFLYVASNLGSMLALISYPVFLEPKLRLLEQSNLWTYGYWFLLFLTMICAFFVISKKHIQEENRVSQDTKKTNVKDRLWWTILSFVPSSLLLGVTSYLSTDISAIPLLWIAPLIIYLFSFVLVFSKKQIFSRELMIKLLPLLMLPIAIYIISGQTKIVWLTFLLHLLTFFVACMVCHGELVKHRPSTKHLTEFYLWISFGGFLGGLFNAVIAPIIFKTVIEYPLALVLACILMPSLTNNKKEKIQFLDIFTPLIFGLILIIISFLLKKADLKIEWLHSLLTLALPAILCYLFHNRPVRFGLTVGVFIFVSIFFTNVSGKMLYTERSFFGVHRVAIDSEGNYRNLIHGRTIHGKEIINGNRPHEPLTYYHKDGPIGQFFNFFNESHDLAKIGVIGLGAGSLAYYGKLNQEWIFYEIDPVVSKIASDEKYFTFLADSKAKHKTILGDGRLSLKKSKDKYFDLIVLDAFSSDAIPMHLITLEAVKLYRSKIKENGFIAFHISNKYINLKPVLGNLASSLDLFCFVNSDLAIQEIEREKGKEPSIWVILTSKKTNLGRLVNGSKWEILSGNSKEKIWSDDFSNILSVFNWGRI